MNGRRIACAGLVTLLLLTGLSSTAIAESGDQRIRGGVVYAVPTDDLTDAGSTTELDEAVGFYVSYERFLGDTIGLEAGISDVAHDITISEPGFPDQEGDTDLMALTINVNFHLMQEKAADFYVGPTVGYAFWDDVDLDVFSQEFPTDDDFLYGVNLGFDVPIGKGKWGFNGALNYLFSELSLEGGSDIGVDPLHLKVGVVYKF